MYDNELACQMVYLKHIDFGMQPSIDCLLGNLAADAYIYNSNGD